MPTPYPRPAAAHAHHAAAHRTELAHHLLVRASAGLIALRKDTRGRTVFVDGEAAPMAYTLSVSVFHALGWLVWWRDLAPSDPTAWWCCHLSETGETVLATWDAQLRKAATA